MSFLKRLFCKHKNGEIIRWHYTHGELGSEPAFIEAEVKCNNCGKTFIGELHENMKEFAEKHADKRY